MKKRLLALCLALITLASVFTAPAGAEGDVEVDNTYTIVYETPDLSAAAQKAADYMQKITGQTYAAAPRAEAPYIKIAYNSEEVEKGYAICEQNGNVLITGCNLAQAVRGVYGFLEKFGGIRCYTDDIFQYTKSAVTVPEGTDYRYEPFFEYTDTDWLSPRDTEFSLFNGLNGAEYRTIPTEMGGVVDYISSFAHSLTNQFCSKDKYFDEHPEYFALYRGFRTKEQLCLSNPDVLRIVTQEVLDLLKERHDPNAELQIVSLTQNDNIFYCTCPECRKTDIKHGSHAGTMLAFTNAVAREVKKAGYDNVALDTFAYRYTRKTPTGIVPEDNVMVRLCSIECCFSHPMDDPDCKANAAFMKDLEGWSKICNRVYIWDYCTNYCNYVGPFPDFATLQRNMQIFYEHNVKGIYEEGNYTTPPADLEFAELRGYLIGRLFRDPYCDYQSEMENFLNAYYGLGGPYVQKIVNMMSENAAKKHLGIYESMTNTFSFNSKEIQQMDALWENAVNAAEGEAKQNVIHSNVCWRYWKMKNHKSEFASLGTYKEKKAELMQDIADSGVTKLMEAAEVRSFFVSLFQGLFFKLYGLVNGVLNILYGVF